MEMIKIPRRIYNQSDIRTYFDDYDIVNDIWGKNYTRVVRAKNGKYYWVEYKFRDYGDDWLQLKLAKKNDDGTFPI